MKNYYIEIIDIELIPHVFLTVDDKNEIVLDYKKVEGFIESGVKRIDGIKIMDRTSDYIFPSTPKIQAYSDNIEKLRKELVFGKYVSEHMKRIF